jgi:hypothetical protein
MYDYEEEAPNTGKRKFDEDNNLPGCLLGIFVYGFIPFLFWVISLFI